MDQFYLDNAKLYQQLVGALDVSVPAPHFSRHKAGKVEKPTRAQYKSDIVTAARIRPMLDDDHAAGFPCAIYPTNEHSSGELQTVHLHDLYNHPRGRPVLKSSKHEVERVYDATASTEDIYTDLVVELVAFARQGGIGTLFAYGQTGSGKTFTISQLQRLAAISLTEQAVLNEQDICVTIVDLAGNSAFDLLDSRKPISVLQDSAGDTQLAGAKECQVSSAEEMLGLIDQAAAYRRTAPTLRNDESSRSHSICRVRIYNKRTTQDISDGVLFLVDLAGSEAARDVASHGADRMRETREINISLSVLKDCIRGKAQSTLLKSRGSERELRKLHVPIRHSTLTKVLKHVFDPWASRPCKTAVIACLNPSLADVGSSKNTLRYAEMLRAPISAI